MKKVYSKSQILGALIYLVMLILVFGLTGHGACAVATLLGLDRISSLVLGISMTVFSAYCYVSLMAEAIKDREARV